MRGCLMFLLMLFTGVLVAQTAVSGIITDADTGDPLIGASVFVTGTTTGTVTDLDGNFSLAAPADAESLTVSYTGYATQELALDGRTTFEVQLASGELLEEVVVVGYGSVKKSDLTGAVVALTEEDFNGGVITSPEELIQGRAAGVQITQTSGEPGAGVNFRIRGTSSVRGNNNPLFVVDGVPLTSDAITASGNVTGLGNAPARNPLNFINPNDIAAIDVLKDASATAIYGSRGANGVVIITTKSGTDGAGVLTYTGGIGFAGITKKYDLLSSDEFLDAYLAFNPGTQDVIDGGADTDWQDELFRTALTHNHGISFGAGNEGGSYRFSASYFNQEGIIEESGLQRLTARFNGQKKFINDRITIGTQITVSDLHDDNVPSTSNAGFTGDLIGNILKANPTNPVFDENGEFFQQSVTELNPLALVKLYEGFTNTLRMLGNISANVELAEGLNFRTVYGIDRATSSRTDAQSRDLVVQGVRDIGRLDINDLRTNNDLWENYLTYDKDLGSVKLNALVGYSYQRFERSGRGSSYANFRTSDLDIMINNLASANQFQDVDGPAGDMAPTVGAVGSNSFNEVDELQSYFTRFTVDLADKYILTATLRADGSTRFGGNNQYGYFPSFAAKWRLLEEDFAPEFFSTLSLRAGYGVVGNQEGLFHGAFLRRQRFGDFRFDQDARIIEGGNRNTGGNENPDLRWESTSQINAGLDFGFNNNRISGSLDYYRKNTNDLLFNLRLAAPAFVPERFDNIDADVINEGVELALNYVAVDKPDFSWDVNFNIAYNNNIVSGFSGIINTGDIDGQGLTGAFAQRIANGQPLYSYFLREFGGFDADGQPIYVGAGDQQVFSGASPLPVWTGGLTNSFRFGNWDANFFFSGNFGQSIYSNTANAFFTAGALAAGRNVTRDVVNNGESRTAAPDVSTRFLEKADFVRLQNASIGYSVPVNGTSVVSNLRFSVTGQNLFVITGYSGQDPEVSISKPINGVPSVGIDYTAYPRARTVTIAVNASF